METGVRYSNSPPLVFFFRSRPHGVLCPDNTFSSRRMLSRAELNSTKTFKLSGMQSNQGRGKHWRKKSHLNPKFEILTAPDLLTHANGLYLPCEAMDPQSDRPRLIFGGKPVQHLLFIAYSVSYPFLSAVIGAFSYGLPVGHVCGF